MLNIFEELKGFKSKCLPATMPYLKRGSLLYLHTAPLIDLYVDWGLAKHKELYSRAKVRELIAASPGFVAHSRTARVGGVMCRCSVFYLNEAPKELKEFLDGDDAGKK